MSWFSRQLYRLLKIITNVVLWIYYPKTAVIHRERLQFDRPTIIACSHPNTMMDPLNVASRTKNPTFFLANANLFATKFGNWFYSNFFCIPIRRSIDNKNKNIKNTDSFDQITAFLGGGGCLWVAPEGGSFWGRHWMPLKMGIAKMALLAEAAYDYDLGLQILPVGLNYQAPNRFRTGLVIHVGEGIEVNTYQQLQEQSDRKAIYHLTKELEAKLQALEISPTDEEEDFLLSKLETILKNEYPILPKAAYVRTQKLLARIQDHKEVKIELEQYVDAYYELLKKYNISDKAVLQSSTNGQSNIWITLIGLLLAFPIFLYGLVNNFFPSFIPYYLIHSRQPYIGYRATINMVLGLVTFPFFYAIQSVLVHQIFDNGWITLLYLLTLIPTGLFAWHFAQWTRLWKQKRRFKSMDSDIRQHLLTLRSNILKCVTF